MNEKPLKIFVARSNTFKMYNFELGSYENGLNGIIKVKEANHYYD